MTPTATWRPQDPTYTANDERNVWINRCFESLCVAYSPNQMTLGVMMEEQCAHAWCHGVVDVLNRALLEYPPRSAGHWE